jgi:RNA polymerase sigma-70 factor (ECF subfamily)
MGSSPDSWTDVSLLGKLRRDPTDQGAWCDFVRRYGPRIYRWCRHWQLQEADAQDVTQTVLAKLVQKMASFEYDPARRFRSWLKTVTQHALSDHLETQRRSAQGSGDRQMVQMLEAVEARDDLVRHLEEEFDQELLEEALLRVRGRVSEQKWEAFRLTALEGLSGAAAAARLHMKVATVFTTKSKVQKLVQEEIARLEQGA